MKTKHRLLVILMVLTLMVTYMPALTFAETSGPGEEMVSEEQLPDVEEEVAETPVEQAQEQNNSAESLTADEETGDNTDVDVDDEAEIEVNESNMDGEELIDSKVKGDINQGQTKAESNTKTNSNGAIEINSIQDLYNIRNGLGRSYILMCDLDLSEATSEGGIYYDKGYGWKPIGTYGPSASVTNDPFRGTFDGNSHVIRGIYSKGNACNNGLFGYNTGTIKNLTIEDSTFEGNNYYSVPIGSIVGYNSGVVENCTASCEFKVNVKHGDDTIGGIAGENTKEINNCTFNGSITIDGSLEYDDYSVSAGGIVAENRGTVSRCTNNGSVSVALTGYGIVYTGGITGINENEIQIAANNGPVSAKATNEAAYAGGVAGSSEGNIQYAGNAGTVYAFSKMQSSYSGGIAGLDRGLVENSENKGSISADNRNNDETDVHCGGIIGHGEHYNPYDVEEEDNDAVGLCANEGIITGYGNGNVWVGGIAGSCSKGFIIDKTKNSGNISGRTRTKLYDCCGCGGICGFIEDATVQNSYNTGIVSSNYKRCWCGGIAGEQKSDDLSAVIQQCYNVGTIESKLYAGGICASNYSMIVNSYNAGNVTGGEAGGISAVNYATPDWLDEERIASLPALGMVYNVGTVNSSNDGITGGITVYNDGVYYKTIKSAVTISYAPINEDYYPDKGEVKEGTEASYNKMLKQSTYYSYNFSKIWKMGTGPYKFPVLRDVIDTDDQNTINLCKCIKRHPYTAWKTITAPTTTRKGIDTRTCSFCGKTLKRNSIPKGTATITATKANIINKTNQIIWDKSNVKGATNYQIRWKISGTSNWATLNVGNTVKGTTTGLKTGYLYEIRVRPYVVDEYSSKSLYGTWSNPAYRYYHTIEGVKGNSKSKGKITVSWKANPKATSYKIYYSWKKNGSAATKTVKTAVKGSKGITISDIKYNGKMIKLKSGTTYYIQVREIRNIDGKVYLGNLSNPVAVRVK